MTGRRAALRASLAAAILALAGCGLSERAYEPRREWPLLLRRDPALPPPPRGPVLLLRQVRAAPGLSARGLQTLRPDGSMDIAYYDEWAVAPADAVEESLRRWLAASGLFAAVIGPGSRLAADYVLEGELTAFWADARERTATASLSLVMLDQSRDPVRIAAQLVPSGRAPLASLDAPAVAAGLTAALADAFAQAERGLAAALPAARRR